MMVTTSSADSVWALLQVIADPERAKAALEELGKLSKVGQEAFAGAQAAQKEADVAQRAAIEGNRQLIAQKIENTLRAKQLADQETALATRAERIEAAAKELAEMSKNREREQNAQKAELDKRTALLVQRERDVCAEENRLAGKKAEIDQRHAIILEAYKMIGKTETEREHQSQIIEEALK
jgi:uncharacterized protein (DUF3084 family)